MERIFKNLKPPAKFAMNQPQLCTIYSIDVQFFKEEFFNKIKAIPILEKNKRI